MTQQLKCRVCGCTEERACATAAGHCSWVIEEKPDPAGPICSACVARSISQAGPGELPLVLDPRTIEALQQRVGFEISAFELFQFLALVQLALRHPGVQMQDNLKMFAVHWAMQAAAELIDLAPALETVIKSGFNPEADTMTPRIIIPGAD